MLNKPIFGPRLLAMIRCMRSAAHCSYSTIETYMEDMLQVPVSRGYLAKLCTGLISDSLDKSYQELKDAIALQEQLGSDETSFKNNGKKHWIWCIASALFTVFHIAPTRSRKVLEELVGEEFAGYLNFDYFSANCSFAWNFWIKAQYCWAQDYFRFMFADGVEPTNNHNEQQIRQCVIDRMITQGTRSEAGQRYHELACGQLWPPAENNNATSSTF